MVLAYIGTFAPALILVLCLLSSWLYLSGVTTLIGILVALLISIWEIPFIYVCIPQVPIYRGVDALAF